MRGGMSESLRILIYGDSNSWGYLDDGLGHRYDRRWPVEMQKHLSALTSVSLTEECLPGRTTDLDDLVMGGCFNGHVPFEAILRSHQPLDHILIMLGTNDLKARFNRTADDIAAAVVDLAETARSVPAGRGSWSGAQTPEVIIVCPLMIGRRARDPGWERVEEWTGAFEKSQALPSALQAACRTAGLRMIDGNQFGCSSERDPIHWDEQTHIRFGKGIARTLQPNLTEENMSKTE